VNWGHDYHYFVGLVRETLVATFAVVAHNFHVKADLAGPGQRQTVETMVPGSRT
jgi:hypothetical protein